MSLSTHLHFLSVNGFCVERFSFELNLRDYEERHGQQTARTHDVQLAGHAEALGVGEHHGQARALGYPHRRERFLELLRKQRAHHACKYTSYVFFVCRDIKHSHNQSFIQCNAVSANDSSTKLNYLTTHPKYICINGYIVINTGPQSEKTLSIAVHLITLHVSTDYGVC